MALQCTRHDLGHPSYLQTFRFTVVTAQLPKNCILQSRLNSYGVFHLCFICNMKIKTKNTDWLPFKRNMLPNFRWFQIEIPQKVFWRCSKLICLLNLKLQLSDSHEWIMDLPFVRKILTESIDAKSYCHLLGHLWYITNFYCLFSNKYHQCMQDH